MSIKIGFVNFIREGVAISYRFLCKIGVCRPKCVCMIDGGICSQLIQYYTGKQIGGEYDVEYDMHFWEKEDGGRDVLGNENRPFELLSLYPDIEFHRCEKRMANFYRRYLQTNNAVDCRPPVYINNYRFDVGLSDFRKYFTLDNAYYSKEMENWLVQIKRGTSCGIHIRRGDLANNDNPHYGLFSMNYINNAIRYVIEKNEIIRFFIFSDDVEWVRLHINEMCLSNYIIVEGNSGREDLLLLANCNYIVASQGTAGRIAALINGKSLLIMKEGDPHNARYLEAHPNCLLIK